MDEEGPRYALELFRMQKCYLDTACVDDEIEKTCNTILINIW